MAFAAVRQASTAAWQDTGAVVLAGDAGSAEVELSGQMVVARVTPTVVSAVASTTEDTMTVEAAVGAGDAAFVVATAIAVVVVRAAVVADLVASWVVVS